MRFASLVTALAGVALTFAAVATANSVSGGMSESTAFAFQNAGTCTFPVGPVFCIADLDQPYVVSASLRSVSLGNGTMIANLDTEGSLGQTSACGGDAPSGYPSQCAPITGTATFTTTRGSFSGVVDPSGSYVYTFPGIVHGLTLGRSLRINLFDQAKRPRRLGWLHINYLDDIYAGGAAICDFDPVTYQPWYCAQIGHGGGTFDGDVKLALLR